MMGHFEDAVNDICAKIAIIGLVGFVTAYLQVSHSHVQDLWKDISPRARNLLINFKNFCISYTFQIALVTIAGENILHRVRKRSFKAILRQDIGWFDQQQTGKLVTRLTE